MKLSISARVFATLVIILGLGVILMAARGGSGNSLAHMLAFLLLGCAAARLKVKLPGLTSSMAVNLPFILIAAAQMGLGQALLVGCISNLVHCLPSNKNRFSFFQTSFNLGNMALAIWATRAVFASGALATVVSSHSLRLGIAAAAFFLVNTVPVAVVVGLAETKSVVRTWLEIAQLSFPYFLASAGIAGVALTVSANPGWQIAAAVLVIMLAVFASYRRYFAALPRFLGDAMRRPNQPESIRSTEVAELPA
jgi:hypothetical protein